MPKHPALDEFVYPPFEGFPKEGLQFLRTLKRNNTRQWFQRHKQEYDENVRFPMQCLVAALAVRMADEAPEIEFNPKRSIFRVYRDVRFSTNKAPYKTNIAASFEMRSKKGGMESPGLYVGIEPGEIFVGGGVYMPFGEQLKAIRRSMAEDPGEFRAIVESRRFKRRFGGILGEQLVNAPLGYPKDHPMIAYLRHKQFYAGVELEEKSCRSARFLETVAAVFTDVIPFVRWLDQVTR
jgi:uncharacterized protein (TIGR02453 family)